MLGGSKAEMVVWDLGKGRKDNARSFRVQTVNRCGLWIMHPARV